MIMIRFFADAQNERRKLNTKFTALASFFSTSGRIRSIISGVSSAYSDGVHSLFCNRCNPSEQFIQGVVAAVRAVPGEEEIDVLACILEFGSEGHRHEVYIPERQVPELMYKLFDRVVG